MFIELLIELKSKDFWAIGSIRNDRLHHCPLKTGKDLRKEGSDSFHGEVDCSITIVRWYDNKAVQLASNYKFINLVDTASRSSKKDKEAS